MPEQTSQSTRTEVDTQELVLRNLPLVRYVLRRLAAHLPPSVDREDLAEAGFIGLIDASRKFDPERGVKFRTYAVSRIRGAMLDELRAQDWLPRTARNELARLARTEHGLHQQLHREPTLAEIARAMDCSAEYIQRLLAVARSDVQISLQNNSENQSTPGAQLPEVMARDEDPRDLIEFEEQKGVLAAAINGLPEHERIVIKLYYFEKRLLREIGERLGLSDSRICQIHRAALERLRYAMKRQELPTSC